MNNPGLKKLMVVTVVTLFLASCASSSSESTTTSTSSRDLATTTTEAASTTTTSTTLDRDSGWVSDLQLLDERLEILHPNPFWRVSKPDWTADLNGVISRVSELTDDELELEVLRLVAQIDGHTAVSTIAEPLALHRYQVRLYDFADGVFVVEAIDPNWVGSRVISIDGTPIADVFEAVSPYISYDNSQTKRLLSPLYSVTPELLTASEVVSDGRQPEFELLTPIGETVLANPPPVSADEWASWAESSLSVPSRPGTLASDRSDEAFWWTVLPQHEAIYLQYNRVARRSQNPETGETTTIPELTEEMSRAVEIREIAKIVVDMRRNPGGDNTTFRELLNFLTEWEQSGSGDLIVITGRQTFSAAANFATFLDVQTEAVFAGEGMGGSPNLYGDATGLTLPYSGIAARISTRFWEIGGPEDNRDTIEPELAYDMTFEDFSSGRDPALDLALNS